MPFEIVYGEKHRKNDGLLLIPVYTLLSDEKPSWASDESLWNFFVELAQAKQIKRGKVYRHENALLVPVAIQATAKADVSILERVREAILAHDASMYYTDLEDWKERKADLKKLRETLTCVFEDDPVVLLEDQAPTYGLVFYSDGGCRLNTSGVAAWGVHGYRYEKNEPSKGLGNGKLYASAVGYIDPTSPVASEQTKGEATVVEHEPVDLLNYIDMYGPVEGKQTNNRAELMGVIGALKQARLEPNISQLHIISDSEYALKAFRGLNAAFKRNWRGSGDQPLANPDLLQLMLELRDEVTKLGVKISVEWVRGHTGNTGNELADMLCNVAMSEQESGVSMDVMTATPKEDYWKASAERNPLLADTRVFMLATPNGVESLNLDPDHHIYYTGNAGSKGSQLGVGDSNRYIGVVALKGKSDFVLDSVAAHFKDCASSKTNLAELRNDTLGHERVRRAVELYKGNSIRESNSRQYPTLTCAGRNVGVIHNPTMLSYYFYSTLMEFHTQAQLYRATPQDVSVAQIDITDRIYERENSPNGVETLTTRPIENFEVEWNGFRFKLVYGLQFPVRNLFNRIKDLNPKVTLMVTRTDDLYAEFAIFLTCDEGWGAWRSEYANRVFCISRPTKG